MRKITEDIGNKIIELYKTGKYNGVEIGNIYNITGRSINKFLKKNSIAMRTMSDIKRKYPICEDFFDQIDTEEKAYVLGFLYADGYNNVERGTVVLRLVETDKEILEKITALIQPTKPLNYEIKNNQNKGSYKNSKNQYKFAIANRHISNRLVELGCGKAKTSTLKFPTEDQVPKYLQRHFIRGYFDGDGSVSVNKGKMFSIIGTEIFITELQKILMENLNFSKTKFYERFPERKTNIRSLMYYGKTQTIKFGEWLYKDATIFLNRKKIKFDSIQ